MIKQLLVAFAALTTTACAQQYGYYVEPTYPVYVQPPVRYVPRYYSEPVYVAPPPRYYYPTPAYGYGYSYPAPSVSFGVGGGRSRVYFNIPLR